MASFDVSSKAGKLHEGIQILYRRKITRKKTKFATVKVINSASQKT